MTQNETSTGFWIPEAQISALARQYPDKLMMLDVVSGVPMTRVPWPSVDLAFWSVQKGFCLPAGLAVVVMSARVIDRASRHRAPAFHGLHQLARDSALLQTTETPNILGIYLLNRVVEKYLKSGSKSIRDAMSSRAVRLYTGLAGTPLTALVEDVRYQSRTVLAFRTSVSARELRDRLAKEHSIQVGAGRGDLVDSSLRVANYPSHTVADHEAFLSAVRG